MRTDLQRLKRDSGQNRPNNESEMKFGQFAAQVQASPLPLRSASNVAPQNRRTFVWAAVAATVAGGGVWLTESLRKKIPSGAINVAITLPRGSRRSRPWSACLVLLQWPRTGVQSSFLLRLTEGTSLFIRRLDTNQLIRMEGTDDGFSPFWSPDSQHIGFFANSKLKRVAVVGGSAIVLCDAPAARGGSWGVMAVIILG